MRSSIPRGVARAVRGSLLAGLLTTTFVVGTGATSHAVAGSTMQLHGALQRTEAVGIVSHRGAAALAPENTLAAMRIAIDQGVEFIEADVHLTADGVPVLLHDPTLDRTTTGTGPVAALTLAELRQLDAGSWFGAEFAGEPVPTLEELLAELDGANVRALVELKGIWTPEQLAATAVLLREAGMVNRVALQSFEPEIIAGLAEAAPEFARVLLTREWDEQTVALAAEYRVSAVGARPKLFAERAELLDRLRELGIGSLAYTLNTADTWRDAGAQQIDLIVTDDPVRLAAWRDETGDPAPRSHGSGTPREPAAPPRAQRTRATGSHQRRSA
ncbi:glycerophosphodiester phosphodiesterase [Leucobacter luti]|uniref:Glycerophosphoryl diester phosphodiesterase n=1 Tax=Leucobacter luti TaxID=340320 RepID=A0A4Q7TZW5_9MICO|nr:glycerophosphodiester phosphodiesterase family protein [Leucobacter luti]MBL3699178.1 hypothetical protein [Leucobacter luti]RZT66676.1 glycerophosphoryl diester phosphodiesterase [Leucobacter luti]